MSALRATAEISDDGKRIDVIFPYSPDAVLAIKGDGSTDNPGVPGRRFVPKEKGGPKWTVPLDLDAGRRLREAFGQGLTLGPKLRAWGRTEVQRRRNLDTLVTANDAELARLPVAAPRLLRALDGEAIPELGLPKTHALSRPRPRRGYQFADISMMAQANVLNANQPGTGKTIEVIGALIESGQIDAGPHIVIAPVKSLVNVWAEEIKRWTDVPVFTAEAPRERTAAVLRALDFIETGKATKQPAACFVVVNAEMVRAARSEANDSIHAFYAKEDDRPVIYRDHRGNQFVAPSELQQRLYAVDWLSVTIDEFHKMGLNNRSSLLHIGLSRLRSHRRYALSGTPMGGKPRKLWPVLNWLEPELYTSFWRWAETWLETEEGYKGSKIVHSIQKGREEEFYRAHARHMIRRLKRDALPGLPDQVQIVVDCGMSPKQEKLYRAFERDAEVLLNDERVSAMSVLAEFARLKQFANAACEVRDDGLVHPTADSEKIEQLLEKLDEEGIRKGDPEPGARAIVSSESKRFVKVVGDVLAKKGIAAQELSGDTKDSASVINWFTSDDPEPRVLVMTIQTGGVSINLECAGSVHALDETWNPDDIEQLFDRADRGGRTEPLRCYIYRTRNTIQEYIAEINLSKAITNKNILDVARQMTALKAKTA